jgi:hypothetical protein
MMSCRQLMQHSAALGRAQRLALRDHELVQIVCYQVPFVSLYRFARLWCSLGMLLHIYRGAHVLVEVA